MGIKIKYIILSAVFCLFSLAIYAQYSQHPPEPRMQDTGGGTPGDGPPCADRVDDGDETTLPPPAGLCLPINNYVYPLLVLGVLLGAYKIQKMEAKT